MCASGQLLDHHQTAVYGSLPLSLGQKSLWSVAGHCQGCLHNARLLKLLWMCSGQGYIRRSRSTGQQRGMVWDARKVCIVMLQEGNCSCLGKVLLSLRWRGWVYRRIQWWSMLLTSWVESVHAVLTPAGVHVSRQGKRGSDAPISPFLLGEVSQRSLLLQHRLCG